MKYLNNHKELHKEYIIIQRKDDKPSAYGEEYDVRKYREHVVWRFPNDWGASVSANALNDFEPELAVVRYKGEEADLAYTTSITNDIIKNVSVPELALYLARIQGLAK